MKILSSKTYLIVIIVILDTGYVCLFDTKDTNTAKI